MGVFSPQRPDIEINFKYAEPCQTGIPFTVLILQTLIILLLWLFPVLLKVQGFSAVSAMRHRLTAGNRQFSLNGCHVLTLYHVLNHSTLIFFHTVHYVKSPADAPFYPSELHISDSFSISLLPSCPTGISPHFRPEFQIFSPFFPYVSLLCRYSPALSNQQIMKKTTCTVVAGSRFSHNLFKSYPFSFIKISIPPPFGRQHK